MENFCIPKQLSIKLKEAAQRGEIVIKDLYFMSSVERREFFKKYTDEATAKGINAGFEKSIASKQKNALKKWAEQTFTGSEKKRATYKNVIDKINKLNKKDLLDPNKPENFYSDLIAEQIGVTISPTEAKNISERAKELEELFEQRNEFNLPTVEYFKKRQEMDKYLQSLVPSSNLKILTSTIFRGNLLFNLKSSITNIVGNSAQGIASSFSRRIANARYKGVADKKLVMDYIKYVNKVYSASGYDVSRLYDLSDTGQKTLGESMTHSQGKGLIRKIGRFHEDFIFKQLLGKPDVLFSSVHFIDSANLAATGIAKKEGLTGKAATNRVNQLIKDATAIKPTTLEGQAIRNQAVADAEYATFTNKTRYTEVAMGIRDVLNKATGDLRFGDQIMPFAKTPANVIGAGIDASGISAMRATWNLKQAITEAKAGNPELLKSVIHDYAWSGYGLTIAFIISSAFKPEDFIGEYPTNEKERELLRLNNATTNSIRIGDRWVSLDYFGSVAAPLVGMLYAKKYGDSMPEKMYRYAQGIFIQSAKIPGVDAISDTIDVIQNARPDKNDSFGENMGKFISSSVDYLSARVIPGIVADIANAFDEVQRNVDYSDPVQLIQRKIPIWRNQLPKKVDVFGDILRNEPWWSAILFGARVKTVNDNDLIAEMNRLDETDNLPSITNPAKTSPRVKEFKRQVSQEKYDQMMSDYYKRLKRVASEIIKTSKYKNMSDEDKANIFNEIKTDALDKSLRKHGYRKPKK